jgi:hypothetical protein
VAAGAVAVAAVEEPALVEPAAWARANPGDDPEANPAPLKKVVVASGRGEHPSVSVGGE